MNQMRAALAFFVLLSGCATSAADGADAQSGWPRYEYYKAADGWRWRFKARNGHCLSDSGQSFDTKGEALASIETDKNGSSEPVVERDVKCR